MQNPSLTRHDQRFFGVLDLACPLADGVTLAVGIRNSLDKSLPIGFCAGQRVMVCDNLAFRSEVVITRKHTKFAAQRFAEALGRAVQTLHQFRQAEAERIRRFQATEVSDQAAESWMLRAYEREIVSARLLPVVIRAWRQPSAEAFQSRTLWSLFNAFTVVLAGRQQTNPQEFAHLTLRLNGFFELKPAEPAEQAVVTAQEVARTTRRKPAWKRNRGWFAKGYDRRRHVFTISDCRLGCRVVMLGLTAKTKEPAVGAWVRLKVGSHFSRKERVRVLRERPAPAATAECANDPPGPWPFEPPF